MAKNFAPASLVARLADYIEAADVSNRAFRAQSTLPSMSDALAHPLMSDFADKCRARFYDMAKRSGFVRPENDDELWISAYAELDRREHNRAVALRLKREAAEQRAALQRELAEISREERVYA